MKTQEQEKIRQAVRESYGKVAKTGTTSVFTNESTSCCGTTAKKSTSGCGSEFTPEQLSTTMGYSTDDLSNVPEGANLGLGCGNPVALASLELGETVVDLGSGGGFDCFLAAKQVGAEGQVIGVDMTPEMVSRARANAEKMNANNIEFRLGEIESLPVADNHADIIMSNCVINLSPDKARVYAEAYRVLKPGGRLAISDILATVQLPEEIQQDLALVSACVGGAATIDETEELLQKVGFEQIRITPKDETKELLRMWDSGKKAGDFIVSAYIEAIKPLNA